MAVTTVQDIFDRVYLILQDDEGTRWNERELLKWLNSAYQQTLLHRPDANARSYKVYFPHADACHNINKLRELTSPADPSPTNNPAKELRSALRLMEVTRNLPVDTDNAALNTDSNAVRHIDKRQFDDQRRGWTGVAAHKTLQYYMYDERNPKEFYVYPRPKKFSESDASRVEVVVSESVDPHTYRVADYPGGTDPLDGTIPEGTTDEVIHLDDIYVEPLIDYIVARCYQKDADYAGNASLVQTHMALFREGLGIKTEADMAVAPVAAPPAGGN